MVYDYNFSEPYFLIPVSGGDGTLVAAGWLVLLHDGVYGNRETGDFREDRNHGGTTANRRS